MKNIITIFCAIIIIALYGCKKDFLDAKPSTELLVPQTLDDFRSLLGYGSLYVTNGLGQMAADEYEFINYATWQGVRTVERNSYIWAKDIYEGELQIADWNRPYQTVFYSNSVLAGLSNLPSGNSSEHKQIEGWALFLRSFANYDLVRTFSNAYDPLTANTDLGIPLRLKPDIDEIIPRSTLGETYEQIISDLKRSCALLPSAFQQNNRNIPSKGTAYALLSRIYLSMNKYDDAELYADSSLNSYNKLIDYNTISTTATSPFPITNDETLFSTTTVGYGIIINSTANTFVTVNPELINSYSTNDLRLSIFFAKNSNGNYYVKRGYYGAGSYPFSGLATDELYLIKSECLARRNQIPAAMDVLNILLSKRFKSTVPYLPMTAGSKEEAISKILLERRKELVWRGIRWSDIKRLNKLGAGLTLSRKLNGVDYVLPPNDPRYALPIPEDEIVRSGINQNPR